jgi:hypothetical protein
MMTYFLIYAEIIIEGPGIVSGVDGDLTGRMVYCSKMNGYILGYDHWDSGTFTYIGQRNKKLKIQQEIVWFVICIYSIDLTFLSFIEISHIYHFGFHFVVNCVFLLILLIVVLIDVYQLITLMLSISLNIRSPYIMMCMMCMMDVGSEMSAFPGYVDDVSILSNLKVVMGSRLWEWPLPICAFHGISDEELYSAMFLDRTPIQF